MMKKNGFTLAEVLITLAIIGVVATMTLPALMTNTQEQQAKTGLKKGTTYYYRLGSAEYDVWGETGSFFTDNGDGKFTFIALTDVQASNNENFYEASLVMNAAMETYPNAELVVNMGDFVNDCTNEEWQDYSKAFGKYNNKLTLAPVAGNHEGNITNKLNVGWFDTTFNLDGASGLLNGTNGTFYSFDYGNAHFCVLNTNDMYPMTEAQRNWIINDLTASDAQWKILMTHRAPYSAGKNINKPTKCLGCITTCNPKETPYCITKALVNAVKGNIDEGLIFCGSNTDRINKIVSVKELMQELACE